MSGRGGSGGSRGHGYRGRGGRARGRGGGGREGRGGSHPPGLTGRQIGMWYAQRGRGKKKEQELRERGTVNLNDDQERQIKRMLSEVEDLRENTPRFDAQSQMKAMQRPADVVCQNFYGHELREDPPLNVHLQEEFARKSSNKQYQKMQAFRQKLPSFKMKDELLSLIRNNQVVVISGETGCGKTTQVPQFILDDYLSRGQGSTCRVVCTQPRRISAITVAERVAAERAEKCGCDNSVGYQIRLENAFPRPQGCILYCTTGILLKWLEGDRLLKSVSHVVLDEVHERDLLSDFLLIILKDLLPLRRDLKLILMSATLRAELFSDYFGQAPMVNIPGFTFAVKEYYLEDILEVTRYEPPRPKSNRQEPVWVKFKKGKAAREEIKEKTQQLRKEFDEYIDAMRGTYSEQVLERLSYMDHEVLDLDLTVELLRYIAIRKPEGAVLVFLPGWDQISKLHEKLTSQTLFSSERFLIIPLHSMMPTINQKQVFDHPPPGVRKIIIATNIAETSITIDDVVYVVNLGRVKEANFDVANNMRTMKAEWVSKASAHQRRGRAGRVKDGECYHVYSQLKASQMEEYQLPEIKRTPLEELCLNIKTLKLGQVYSFISKAMEVPDERAIQLAISSLKQMRAFDDNEELTALGYHLSRIPAEPRIGKMMLFGAMFCCLDPILTIAASLSWKDPFIIPLGKEKLADERRRELSNNTRSDHLMLCNAMSGWEEAKENGEDRAYCWRNFMSSNILSMLSKMKGQFCEVLHHLRFVSHRSPKHIDANRNSENEQLVKAVLCAGLYPKVAHIDKVSFNRKTGQFRPPAKLRTPEDGRVEIHLKSVNAQETTFSSKWMLYHLKIRSTSVYLHDTTMVEPYPLIFCGGKISWDEDHGHETVFVDDHVRFNCSQETAHLVIKLREELDKVMEEKITNPGPTNWSQTSHEGRVMRAIVDILIMHSKDTYDNDEGFVSRGAGNDRYDDDYDEDCEDSNQGFVRRGAGNDRRDDDYDEDTNRGFARRGAHNDWRDDKDSSKGYARHSAGTDWRDDKGSNQGFVRRGVGNDRRDDDYGEGDEDYDDDGRGGGQRYGQSGNRYHNNDRPGSSHWRPDTQRRRHRGNPHQRYWTQN